MADDDSAVVATRRAPVLATRQALERCIATLAVASLILEHGSKFGQRFFAYLFDWLDVLLACGLVILLLTQVISAKRWQDVIDARRFEMLVLGGCATLLLLLILALANRASVQALPEFDRYGVDKLVFGTVQFFLLGNVCIQLLRYHLARKDPEKRKSLDSSLPRRLSRATQIHSRPTELKARGRRSDGRGAFNLPLGRV